MRICIQVCVGVEHFVAFERPSRGTRARLWGSHYDIPYSLSEASTQTLQPSPSIGDRVSLTLLIRSGYNEFLHFANTFC